MAEGLLATAVHADPDEGIVGVHIVEIAPGDLLKPGNAGADDRSLGTVGTGPAEGGIIAGTENIIEPAVDLQSLVDKERFAFFGAMVYNCRVLKRGR
jgi:hypothetical protein